MVRQTSRIKKVPGTELPFRPQCRKKPHKTHGAALVEMHKLYRKSKKTKKKGGKLNVYFCTTCEAWHVGHEIPEWIRERSRRKR
jgi:hypothetical protein